MEFASLSFIFIFLPVLLLLYYSSFLIKNRKFSEKAQNTLLFSAGLFFYASAGGVRGLTFILIYLFVNFLSGLLVEKSAEFRKRTIAVSLIITANILMLLYFKYNGMINNFSVILNEHRGNLKQIIIAFGNYESASAGILLPFAFSFIVFQVISYLSDIYTGKTNSEHNFFRFLFFMLLFMKTAQGPIMRYGDLSCQIKRPISQDNFIAGITRFCFGLAKKVLLADTFAKAVNAIWLIDVTKISTDLAWLGSVLYSLQIYFDFSGYSDMAVGLGYFFGFEIDENFILPYSSLSIQEFWRRWHISLSSWFRDYLYIPLGGSRCATGRILFNLFVVFLATGIWHGSNLTFVVWGLYYAFFMIIERLFLGKFLKSNPLKLLNRIYMLSVINLGWVLFRAPSLYSALEYLKAMFTYVPSPDGTVALSFLPLETLIFALAGIIISGAVRPARWQEGNCCSSAGFRAIKCTLSIILAVFSAIWIINGSYSPSIYAAF